MKIRNSSLFVAAFALNVVVLFGLCASAPAADANQRMQDRYSAPVMKHVPSTATQARSKWDSMTTDQKFSVLLGTLDAAEGKIATLQNQVQANSSLGQEITQLRNTVQQLSQVITTSPLGEVTIQTAQKLKLSAAIVEVSASNIKVQAAMSGFHGILKADTMITNTVVSNTYTPGAGNIW
ncbi:MAG: hypothetical protein AB7P17_11280 [Nitrospirales bacterium]|nr:hypothetical protein [Nitrospirales bacterium]